MSRKDRISAARNNFRRRLKARGFCSHSITMRLDTFSGADELLNFKGDLIDSKSLTMDPPPLLDNLSITDRNAGNNVVVEGEIHVYQVDFNPAYQPFLDHPETVYIVEGPEFAGEYKRIRTNVLEIGHYAMAISLRKIQVKKT